MNDQKFSILIPSWNNLSYLKLCVDSIEKNSRYKHQILIYINEGNDGSLEWVKQNKYEYIHSDKNQGVCYPLNSLRRLVKTNYMVFMNDDMYCCPDWDFHLLEEIKKLNHNRFFYSGTLIQPNDFWCKSVISNKNYGTNTDNFKEKELLAEYNSFDHNDWHGATWPPNIIHKDIWDLVGGYSTELSPGMYSDPDFTAKLWFAGIREIKGISKSRIYHFEAKSTGKVKKNPGSKQFLLKWGLTANSFTQEFLKRGVPYSDETVIGKLSKKRRLRNTIKKLYIKPTNRFNF